MKFQRRKSLKSIDNVSKGFGQISLQGNIFNDVRQLKREKEKGYNTCTKCDKKFSVTT